MPVSVSACVRCERSKQDVPVAQLHTCRSPGADCGGGWQVLERLDLGLAPHELADLMRTCDQDGDGRFSYQEFLPLIRAALAARAAPGWRPHASSLAGPSSRAVPVGRGPPRMSQEPRAGSASSAAPRHGGRPSLAAWLDRIGFRSAEGPIRDAGFDSVEALLAKAGGWLDKQLKVLGIGPPAARRKFSDALDAERQRQRALGPRPRSAPALPQKPGAEARVFGNDLWRS